MALAGFLKQSTAVTITVGPFLDSTDGNSQETALTISQADVVLSKNGGTFAQKNNSTSCTHDTKGYYSCPLSTTDTNTLGILTVAIHESGALAVRQDYLVLAANVYDALVGGGDYLDVEVATLATAAVTSIVTGFQARSHSGTLQAGAAGTATLAADASAVDDYYNNSFLIVISSTGTVQVGWISDYVGSTKVCTMAANWGTTPSNTYKYIVVGQ